MREIRAFIALELPGEVKKSLGELCAKLARKTRGYRWIRPESAHLTLKFLGNLDEARFAGIAALVGAGVDAGGPFALVPQGVGGFPNEKRARVVWAGLGGETVKLNALAVALEEGLASLSIAREARPFAAHLTLGREVRDERAGGMAAALPEFSGWRGPEFWADEVVLFESVLKPGGAVHIERARGKIR